MDCGRAEEAIPESIKDWFNFYNIMLHITYSKTKSAKGFEE